MGKECSKRKRAPSHGRTVLQLCLLVSLGQQAQAANSEPMRLDGLLAVYLVLEFCSGRIFERSQIALSESGLRIDQSGRGFRILANYHAEKLWLVDRLRNVVHTVPATFVDKSEKSPLRRTGESSTPVLVDTGLLSYQSC